MSFVRWRPPLNRSHPYPHTGKRRDPSMTAPEADLTGWSAEPFTGGGYTHDVYRRGDGPGVVLIPEIPGIHPGVLGLGNHLVDNGFTVAIPSLFGEPGRPVSVGYTLDSLRRVCVAREFAALATNKHRPVADFLRALARDLKASTPGKGVGVIGQCFTGGFALAAAVDDSVLAPVLSQPSTRCRPQRRRTERVQRPRHQARRVRDGPAVQQGLDVTRRTVHYAQRAARRRVRGDRDRLRPRQ